jgi:hypothetical protein
VRLCGRVDETEEVALARARSRCDYGSVLTVVSCACNRRLSRVSCPRCRVVNARGSWLGRCRVRPRSVQQDRDLAFKVSTIISYFAPPPALALARRRARRPRRRAIDTIGVSAVSHPPSDLRSGSQSATLNSVSQCRFSR